MYLREPIIYKIEWWVCHKQSWGYASMLYGCSLFVVVVIGVVIVDSGVYDLMGKNVRKRFSQMGLSSPS